MPDPVLTDATRLRQILVNLVANAVKFTPSGSIDVDFRCSPREDGRLDLTITVADTGIGMTEQQLQNIFRPFGQADASTTRRFGGTGLGLSISRKLARLLGGDITVTNEAGVGSTFTARVVVRLPVRGVEAVADTVAPLTCRPSGFVVESWSSTTLRRCAVSPNPCCRPPVQRSSPSRTAWMHATP